VIGASCVALTHFLRKNKKLSLCSIRAKYSGLISRYWNLKGEKLERFERVSSYEQASLFVNSTVRLFTALCE
jgi:hypothetical protein